MTAPIEKRNHQIVIWQLRPEGACGIGDHSRRVAEHLGGRIVDVAKGERPLEGPQLIQYAPNAWAEKPNSVRRLVGLLGAHPAAERVLFVHEVRRRLGQDPRSWRAWVHDVMALRTLLPKVNRVLVTTQRRAAEILRMMETWACARPIDVVGVCSTVHRGDPDVGDIGSAWWGRGELVLFARGGAGVLGAELARVVAAVVALRPNTRVTLLGDRAFARRDPLLETLGALHVLERVEITGMLPGSAIVARLRVATVGLTLHDTGAGGRRTTLSAMLAAGVPVVSGVGEDTDDWLHQTPGVVLATDCARPDIGAVARAVVRLLDEKPEAQAVRRRQAMEAYESRCSIRALARTLGQSLGDSRRAHENVTA